MNLDTFNIKFTGYHSGFLNSREMFLLPIWNVSRITEQTHEKNAHQTATNTPNNAEKPYPEIY